MYVAMQKELQAQGYKKVNIPLSIEERRKLSAGEKVALYGELITIRDRAHIRLIEDGVPISLKDKVIYYAGPTKGGIFGPTTSFRMDAFLSILLPKGVAGAVGKGPMRRWIFDLMGKYAAVYFVTVGGIAALLSKYILKSSCLLYPEMGPEAIYSLEVEGFPAYVAYDTEGRCIWKKHW